MAKLNGVNVVDMCNGKVEKVSYQGEEYVRVEGDAQNGDIALVLEGWGSIREREYRLVISQYRHDNADYVQIAHDGLGKAVGFREDLEVFRKASAIYDLTYEGVNYRKVTGRKAQKGDYLVFSEEGAEEVECVTAGKPYLVEGIDSFGDCEFTDDREGERAPSLDEEYYEVYEKVSEGAETEASERLQVGDYAEVIANNNLHGFDIGEIIIIKRLDDDDGYLAERIDGSGYWYVDDKEIRKISVTMHEGRPYREVNRKADAGELIKVVSRRGDEDYEIGEIIRVKGEVQASGHINSVKKKFGIFSHEYIVLEPLFNEEVAPPTKAYQALIITMDGREYRETIELEEDIIEFVELVDEGITLLLPENNVYIPAHNVASIKAQVITGGE